MGQPSPPPSNLCPVPKRVASADYQTEFEVFFSDFTRIVEFVSLGCPIQESRLVTGRFDLFQRQFLNAGYPKRFISYTVNSFLQVYPKMTILSRVFFLKSVRRFSSSSLTVKEMKNLGKLLSLSCTISRVSTHFQSSPGKQDKSKVFSTLRTKTLSDHRSHVVYKSDCSCGVDYIRETRRNVEVRIDEHSNSFNDSEPVRHLLENPTHSFSSKCTAQTFHKRRIIEGLMIQQWSPSLNKQVHSYVAKLFPSGIT